MRPEFRSTRSARIIPLQSSISKQKIDDAQHARRASLPPTTIADQWEDLTLSSKKRSRHRLTDEQASKLDAMYAKDTHPTTEQKRSLGKDIGLEIKTVSVWFQNKRQKGHLSASSSSSSDIDGIKRISLPPRTTPIRKRVQSPLPHDEDAVRPHLSPMAAYDRTVDKSASREINIFAKCQPKIHKSLDEVAIPADELWKHLLSSPPTVSEMSDIDADDEDAANILVNFFANDQKAVNKRSLILEWACDRQSKKRKGDRGDPTNDTMPDAATEICLRCLQPRRLDSSLAKRMSLPTTTVHPSEDVMHAVSLLLCFKYAAQISLR